MLLFMDVVLLIQISTSTATDDVVGQLITIRLLIGVFEAGFYPTAIFYLSTFYTRFDLAVRIALFYGQYAIAGAFSGAICM
jgi:MFS family permease